MEATERVHLLPRGLPAAGHGAKHQLELGGGGGGVQILRCCRGRRCGKGGDVDSRDESDGDYEVVGGERVQPVACGRLKWLWEADARG